MPLTDEQITQLARILAKKIFVQAQSTAHSNVIDLKAAINRLDQIFAATTTQIAAAAPGAVLRVAILNEIKLAAPSFSNQDAAVALVIWVADAAGIADILEVR